MAIVDCYTLPASEAAINGRPILAVAANLANGMHDLFPELGLIDMAAKLAEACWFDAAEDEADDCPPGTMWWAVVHVFSPSGITELHIQAEPAGHGVVVYLPVIDEHGAE